MLYNALHNRWLRLIAALVGEALVAVGINLFIVPLDLYSGGVLGVCQLIRTLLQTSFGMNFGTYDIAGVLYFLVNIPIPAVPIVEDYLTSCLIGGFFTGLGSGIVLTCGCSSGGLDVIGLCLSKKGSSFTVGRFSLTFNIFLYAACLFLFNVEVAIYSIIYNFATVIVMDRMHQQNVNVQALIFTRGNGYKMGQHIIATLGRGVTYWNGAGAYTDASIRILCVCLSKYEIEDLIRTVRAADPNAFFTIQEGVQVYGNFQRKIG